jgi:hypothetical protein
MARVCRKAPGVSEDKTFRAREAFDNDVEAILRLAAQTTVNVGSISAGAVGTFTVLVAGARADKGMTVQVGVPSNFNTGLTPWGYVSADDEVTVVLRNTTGGAIDPSEATYAVRVMP